jgi:hypothetical protein
VNAPPIGHRGSTRIPASLKATDGGAKTDAGGKLPPKDTQVLEFFSSRMLKNVLYLVASQDGGGCV